MIVISPITKTVNEVNAVDITEFTRNVETRQNQDNEYYVVGDGIFDDLMETATAHLDAQYNNQRIRGELYATTYAEIYKATLEVAANLWIQKAKTQAESLALLAGIDKTNAETKEIAAREELVNCQARLACAQAAHEVKKQELTEATTKHEGVKERLTEAQIATEKSKDAFLQVQTAHEKNKDKNTQAQTSLLNAQTDTEKAKKTLTVAQANQVIKQTDLIITQTNHEDAKILNTKAQTSLLKTQNTHEATKNSNTKAQTSLINSQITHEAAKKINTDADTYLKRAQASVASQQINLMLEQVKSEQAKINLYEKQAAAFLNEIKYKFYAKALDTWGVGFTTAPDSFEECPKVVKKVGLDRAAKNRWKELFNVNTDDIKETTSKKVNNNNNK